MAPEDLELLNYLENFVSAERKARFLEILNRRTRFLTVAIEDVYQMHNASAVIRSCEVFGIQDAHLIERRFGHRLDKHIAMGAQKWVDVHRHDTSEACLQQLRSKGYQIVATCPQKTATSISEFKISAPIAIFFGTEKEGLSQEVMAEADIFLTIPMAGFTESLNISVAAAILLQQLAEQLRKSDLPWRLTEDEILEKRLDWTIKSIKSADKIIERFKS